MNIISDFNDYYDCVLRLDQDRDYKFVRVTNDLPLEEVLVAITDTKYDIRKRTFFDSTKITLINSNVFALVVCGKIYPGVYDNFTRKNYLWHTYKDNFYNTIYHERHSNNNKTTLHFDDNQFETVILPLLEGLKDLTKDCPYYRVNLTYLPVRLKGSNYRSSYSDIYAYGITKYPILKEYDFAKVVDPYTMYQEIDMWFGRNASINEISSTTGTDEELAEAKGFDRKYSFRKPKRT
jgi:hypothetical protein